MFLQTKQENTGTAVVLSGNNETNYFIRVIDDHNMACKSLNYARKYFTSRLQCCVSNNQCRCKGGESVNSF